MMKVSFAEVDEQYLRDKVEQGFYSSIAEAIRDMVRKNREREQGRRPTLHELLEVAEEDIRQGRTTPYSRELLEQAAERGIEKAKRGEPFINRPEVTGDWS